MQRRLDSPQNSARERSPLAETLAFASGQYRPGTLAGDALIAHELAHTIQQRNGRPAGMGQASGELELEGQADRAAIVPSRAGKDRHLLFGPPEMEFLSKDPLTDAALAALLLTAEVGTDVVIAIASW